MANERTKAKSRMEERTHAPMTPRRFLELEYLEPLGIEHEAWSLERV